MHPKLVTVPGGFWSKGVIERHRCTVILDKPKTIEALKDNIREVIGEMQMHTIDNVLKNWTHCIGYCMTSRGSHLSEIIFYY